MSNKTKNFGWGAMHYRIVCSTEDFRLNEYQEVYVTDDYYEIEDFIIIVDNYKKYYAV